MGKKHLLNGQPNGFVDDLGDDVLRCEVGELLAQRLAHRHLAQLRRAVLIDTGEDLVPELLYVGTRLLRKVRKRFANHGIDIGKVVGRER